MILSLYARGMTTRDIHAHLAEIYGVEVSPALVSAVTDVVADEITECVHSRWGVAVNWCQRTAGGGGSQGLLARASRMASSAVMPWVAAWSRRGESS